MKALVITVSGSVPGSRNDANLNILAQKVCGWLDGVCNSLGMRLTEETRNYGAGRLETAPVVVQSNVTIKRGKLEGTVCHSHDLGRIQDLADIVE